jgi:hypothetical protein
MTLKHGRRYIGCALLLLFSIQGCHSPSPSFQLQAILYRDWAPDKEEIDSSLALFEDPRSQLVGYEDNSKKHIIITPRFARGQPFNKQGIANVQIDSNGDWYKINKEGKILAKSYFFDNGPDYSVSGLSRFIENGKIGFIDYTGRKVIPARYDWVSPFFFTSAIAVACIGCQEDKSSCKEEGCCHAEIKGGKWGAINKQGQIIVPFEFERASHGSPQKTLTFFKGNDPYEIYTLPSGKFVIHHYDQLLTEPSLAKGFLRRIF